MPPPPPLKPNRTNWEGYYFRNADKTWKQQKEFNSDPAHKDLCIWSGIMIISKFYCCCFFDWLGTKCREMSWNKEFILLLSSAILSFDIIVIIIKAVIIISNNINDWSPSTHFEYSMNPKTNNFLIYEFLNWVGRWSFESQNKLINHLLKGRNKGKIVLINLRLNCSKYTCAVKTVLQISI